MSQLNASYRVGDVVSYKYNGMRGTVTAVQNSGNLDVLFPSQNNRDLKISVSLTENEVELIAGAPKSLATV
jgi:uncharacterized protein YkvS